MIPELKGKLHGFAVRAPVPTGSVVDLTFEAERETTVEEINAAIERAGRQGPLKGILEYTEDPIVSSDIVKNPHSSIFDSALTAVHRRHAGQGRLLVRQRVGLLQPLRGPRPEGARACARSTTSTSTGKRVLVRVDFNVPLDDDGDITDDARIRAALPTLRELREKGARLVLLLAPRAPEGPRPEALAAPAAERLAELLGRAGRARGRPRRRARRATS